MTDAAAAEKPKVTDEALLTLLRETYQAKLTGRGDIQSYQIGGRQISTFSLEEINNQINAIQSRINATKNKGRPQSIIYWKC